MDRRVDYVETIEQLLLRALQPVGETMYIWGGGWNASDTGAGWQVRSMHTAAAWKTFADQQDAAYDYRLYRYRNEKGLDCSGYIGWCIYGIGAVPIKEPVRAAGKQAGFLAELGWGSYREPEAITDYCPGDIMSSVCDCCRHVWMVIGQCEDGSVVLLHASPPGVQLGGTVTPSGKTESEAFRLATDYMKRFAQEWVRRFPVRAMDIRYLTHYGQMRWDITSKGVVSDPEGYRKRSAGWVLQHLYEKRGQERGNHDRS